MKKSIVMSVLAMGISGFADCAAQGDDAFLVGVSGFSKAVCNEAVQLSFADGLVAKVDF